jgi:hypothetical protein
MSHIDQDRDAYVLRASPLNFEYELASESASDIGEWTPASSGGFRLPSWMFDVVDNDDRLEIMSSRKSLIEELEIDPLHILQVVVWQFKCPLFALLRRFNGFPSVDNSRFAVLRWIAKLCGRVIDYQSHPIRLSSTYRYNAVSASGRNLPSEEDEVFSPSSSAIGDETRDTVDFWGPLAICTSFSALLWLGDQKNVPYVYIIWLIGGLLTHLTVRPFLDGSGVLFHLAILGYSLCPQIPIYFLLLLLRPSVVTCLWMHFLGITWSCTAALMSYNMILWPLIARTEDRIKLRLLVPIVLLFHVYMSTLVPVRQVTGQPVAFA